MNDTSLDIIIRARDRVSKVLTRLRQRFQSFATQLARVGKIAAFFSGAALAGVSAAILEMGRRGAQTVDRLAKLARQTGENINTLNALREAADRAGVGMDVATQAVLAMQKRLGEAVQGRGMAKDVLEQLGLSPERLAGMSVENQLATIADAMAGVESQTIKAQIAANLFSRAGQSMVLMLQDGGDAFRDSLRSVSRFQAKLNNIDAAGVERANDAVGNLKTAIAGLGQLIAVQMAPQIERFSNRLASQMARLASRLAKIMSGPFRAMLFAINNLFDRAGARGQDFIDRLVGTLEKLSGKISEFIATLPARIKLVSLQIEKMVRELQRALLEPFTHQTTAGKFIFGDLGKPAAAAIAEIDKRLEELVGTVDASKVKALTDTGRAFTPEIEKATGEVTTRIPGLIDEARKALDRQTELFKNELKNIREKAKENDHRQALKQFAERVFPDRFSKEATKNSLIDTLKRMVAAAPNIKPPALVQEPASRRIGPPELVTGRFLTGAGSKTREQIGRQQLEEAKKQKKLLNSIDANLQTLREDFPELTARHRTAIVGGLF